MFNVGLESLSMGKQVFTKFLLIVFLLGLSFSTSADELDDNEYINVETYGKITNITVNTPELKEQNEYLKRLQTTPLTDEAAWQDLFDRRNEITPPLLYELALRTFSRDKEEAVKWFWIAGIRSRLDAVLCTDTTAAQGILFISQRANAVAIYIKENPVLAGQIGLKALEEEDLMAGTASPWWICSHGVQAANTALKGNNPKNLDWLKPTEDWEPLFDKILAAYKVQFESLFEPMDDPVPLIEINGNWITSEFEGHYKKMQWLDNETLVFAEEGGNYKNPNYLYLWNMSSEPRLISDDLKWVDFCVSNEILFFETALEWLKTENGTIRKRIYQRGKIDFLQTYNLEEPWKTIEEMKAEGATSFIQDSEWGLNPITCNWETSKTLNQDFPKPYQWVSLGKEKGFLVSVKDHEKFGTGFFYLADENSAPRELSKINFNLRCLKEIGFENSMGILMGCELDFVDYKGRPLYEGQNKIFLLNFDSDQAVLTEEPYEFLPNEQAGTFTLYTKRGLFRTLEERKTPLGKKEGGLYWYKGNGEIVKIWEGYPKLADVSPDGCRIAFTFLSRKPGEFGSAVITKIGILDVCQAFPE